MQRMSNRKKITRKGPRMKEEEKDDERRKKFNLTYIAYEKSRHMEEAPGRTSLPPSFPPSKLSFTFKPPTPPPSPDPPSGLFRF